MEFNAEELRAYIKAFNSIHVDTPEEHHATVELLRELGFQIGYKPENEWDRCHYISFGNFDTARIHTRSDKPMYKDKEIVEYKDLPVRFPMDKTFSCASPAELLALLQMA